MRNSEFHLFFLFHFFISSFLLLSFFIETSDCVFLDGDLLTEPYFIGRILELSEDGQMRVNWFHRSKDIPQYKKIKGIGVGSAKVTNPRVLLATMHWDWNPVESVRGKCCIKHMSEVWKDVEGFFFLLLKDIACWQ